MKIIGISAFFHDSAVAVVENGNVLLAAQEERFSRVKNDSSFPVQALSYCLDQLKNDVNEADAIIFYEKPFLKFERIIESYFHYAPKGFSSFIHAMPSWIGNKLLFKKLLRKNLLRIKSKELLFCDHHLSHAAFSFFTSGFENAAILTIDAVGEWATTSIQLGESNRIRPIQHQHYPSSLGLLYSAFTFFLGFKVNSGEYKVMGLAPYGDKSSSQFKRFRRLIEESVVKVYKDGSIHLNDKYFSYSTSLKMIPVKKWEGLFGMEARRHDSEIAQAHCDLALAIQTLTEEIILRIGRFIRTTTKLNNLCLGGGVALNCAANGKLAAECLFDKIHVPFAPGDAGSAIGSALAASHLYYNADRNFLNEKMTNPYLGQGFNNEQVREILIERSIRFLVMHDDQLYDYVSSKIAEGYIVGWFQGRSEFGPRALGNRSILADPRISDIQHRVNTLIKERESFRPFAPAVLAEYANEVFHTVFDSPYMQFIYEMRDNYREACPADYSQWELMEKLEFVKSKYPSVTHVDFTSRIQTVSKENNLRFWNLLMAFKLKTGCPMILNTSFNRNNEPIVNSPQEALDCFNSTNLDILVINNFIVDKIIE